MHIICSDLEGVFVPEIWINVARNTGIEELRLTTRDISDYNILMRRRLEILHQNGLTIRDIRKVISSLRPLPGAKAFIDWLRSRSQLIIVSDTFIEFADPLIEQLGRPTLFCNSLVVDKAGNINNYNLRQKDGKRMVTEALQKLNYKVIAVGDSYNDISMLRKADLGILFNPPHNIIKEHSDLLTVKSFKDLKTIISKQINNE
jgi:phosphoserine/homoserine phosphotransferase